MKIFCLCTNLMIDVRYLEVEDGSALLLKSTMKHMHLAAAVRRLLLRCSVCLRGKSLRFVRWRPADEFCVISCQLAVIESYNFNKIRN